MKYSPSTPLVDTDKRKLVNQKFQYLLAKGELLDRFSAQEVYQYYTGKGGLHGLNQSDFKSFHDYTKAKQKIEQGAFFTPDLFMQKIHRILKLDDTLFVADLSFGKGTFFNYCPNENNIFGCELDVLSADIAMQLFPKGNLYNMDFRQFSQDHKMDLVFGNPPFNLRLSFNGGNVLSQMIYLYKAAEILKQDGILVLLVPHSFLSDSFYNKYDRESVDKHFELIAQTKLDSKLFREAGVEEYETKLMFFRHASLREGEKRSNDYDTYMDLEDEEQFHEYYISPLIRKLKSASSRLANAKSFTQNGSDYKIRKLLYDIKRQQSTREYYPKCIAYVNKYNTQQCPSDMSYEFWVKHHRITLKMVYGYLRRYLWKHNPKKAHKPGEMIKSDFHLVTYGKGGSKESESINDIIYYNKRSSLSASPYAKLMRRKRRAYEHQITPYNEMPLCPHIQQFLKQVSLVNEEMEPIHLNTVQMQDTNRILQKHYNYCQWDMGTGKTISGIAQIKYRLLQKQIAKVFVVGPAIAIDGTWDSALKKNGISALNVKSLSDLNMGMSEAYDVVMLSHYYLGKYERQLKKLVKRQKVFLVVDEADEYSNPSSIRTKRVLSIFRRVKYKTLMSGTSVRNNIVEFYPQLELLYNNSIYMMDETHLRYWINTKPKEGEVGEVMSKNNPNQYKPFPAWRGFGMYKGAFNPSKVTVFGAKKHDQKIYNHEELARLLDYTIITRTFKEVTGREIHEIHQDFVTPYAEEVALQEKIKESINAFYGVHISSTGDARKDAMLRLLHQMNLLFKSCAMPVHFSEYPLESSSKYEHVKKYLSETQQRIAIGGIHIQEMMQYKEWISRDYPEKTIFYIDGSMSIKRRKGVVEEMKLVSNSVLISTTGALKSSLNINFIDKILVVSLPWNFSILDQFQKRFCRYDSVNFKHIHYITLANSIESNLLNVLVDKDALVSFMRTKKLHNSTQLNVDLDLLLSMIVDRDELKKSSEEKEEAA